MAQHHHVNLVEREELSRMLAAGYNLRAIGQALSRAPSTLSRELTRHHALPVTYRALRWAHQPRQPRKLAVQPRLRLAVCTLLAQRWSPEQIARGVPQRYPDDPTLRLSHDAIETDRYVLPRGTFKRGPFRFLRRRHPFRRPRKVGLSSRPIQDLSRIDERPAEGADHRTGPGHREGDLLVGHANASALGTVVERPTRFTLLMPLNAKDAVTVRQGFACELRPLSAQLRRALTCDQGPEMREHRLVTKPTMLRVYCAHPHSP